MTVQNEGMAVKDKGELIANELVSDIQNDRIKKDTLMNNAKDFSGDGESRYIINYRKYLRSALFQEDMMTRA